MEPGKEKRSCGGVRAHMCGRCGVIFKKPVRVSWKDGRTVLCPDCGVRESLERIGVPGGEKERILRAVRGNGAGPAGDYQKSREDAETCRV